MQPHVSQGQTNGRERASLIDIHPDGAGVRSAVVARDGYSAALVRGFVLAGLRAEPAGVAWRRVVLRAREVEIAPVATALTFTRFGRLITLISVIAHVSYVCARSEFPGGRFSDETATQRARTSHSSTGRAVSVANAPETSLLVPGWT